MNNPAQSTALAVIAENIPAELRNLNQWVCWHYEERGGKPTKPPIQPKSNGKLLYAKSNDPSTWADFGTALATTVRLNLEGVGFNLAESDGLTGLDLDHVFDPATGELNPLAAEVLERFKDTYTETSPSGTGIRIWCRGKPGRSGKCDGKLKWLEVYSYPSKRYLTVTGHHWAGSATGVTEQQDALDWLHETYMVKADSTEEERVLPPVDAPPDMDDDALLEKARRAKKGAVFSALWSGDLSGHGNDHSAADLALMNILAFWTGGDAARMDRLYWKSGLKRDKWNELRGEKTYGQMTIAKALEQLDRRDERDTFLKNYVYLSKDNLFADVRTAVTYSPVAFTMLAEKELPKQWKGAMNIIFARRQGRILTHDVYRPGQPRIVEAESTAGIIEPLFNIFNAPKLPEPQYNAAHEALLVDHLMYITDNNEPFVNYLLNYLATLIQFPGRKMNNSPVIIGPKGNGKSFIADLMTAILGKSNTSVISTEELEGSFQDDFAFKQLCVVEEIKVQENQYSLMERLKPWITNKRVAANRKNRAKITVDNVGNWMFFSNHDDALRIDAQERRYAVAISRKLPKAPTYYNELFSTFIPDSGGSVASVLYLLKSRDLSQFNPHEPAIFTEARAEMIENLLSGADLIIKGWMEGGVVPDDAQSWGLGYTLKGELITATEWGEAVRLADAKAAGGMYTAKAPSARRIGAAARAAGLTKLGQKRLFKEAKENVYAIRNAEFWSKQSEGAMKEYLTDRQACWAKVPSR